LAVVEMLVTVLLVVDLLVVLLVAVLVCDDDEEVVHLDVPTPTQYASPAQKLVRQSEETEGFHARNCWEVILNCCSML
jgi:hypothetical protein